MPTVISQTTRFKNLHRTTQALVRLATTGDPTLLSSDLEGLTEADVALLGTPAGLEELRVWRRTFAETLSLMDEFEASLTAWPATEEQARAMADGALRAVDGLIKGLALI